MKRLSHCILLGYFGIILNTQVTHSQEVISYGSHNGNSIEIKNTDLYYEEYGSGHPTLLLHGGMGSISNFKKVIPGLSKHFKLWAIDSPGHGRSKHIDSLSYDILANHVVEFINALQLKKVNIIGYSDGAIVGMLVAHKLPSKIDKLVFGAGALNPHASTPEGLKFLNAITPEILPESFAISYKKKSPNPKYWEKFVYASKNMWLSDLWIPEHILPQINTKVLVLFGDSDPFIPLGHALKIHHQLPNSTLGILPSVGHEIFNDHTLVNPILIRFLSN